jgi:acetyl-CoA carboxylase carboxyltransferase component
VRQRGEIHHKLGQPQGQIQRQQQTKPQGLERLLGVLDDDKRDEKAAVNLWKEEEMERKIFGGENVVWNDSGGGGGEDRDAPRMQVVKELGW